jgi:hypothetical protein
LMNYQCFQPTIAALLRPNEMTSFIICGGF